MAFEAQQQICLSCITPKVVINLISDIFHVKVLLHLIFLPTANDPSPGSFIAETWLIIILTFFIVKDPS